MNHNWNGTESELDEINLVLVSASRLLREVQLQRVN